LEQTEIIYLSKKSHKFLAYSFFFSADSPCNENNGGCEFMCLAGYDKCGNSKASCVCPDNMKLDKDGKSCGKFSIIS